MDNITLIIDDKVISDYEREYFLKNKRARKKPIDSPTHPSINRWMIMRRPAMNALKQKYKDFVIFFLKQSGYWGLGIKECDMTFISYFKTRVRRDCDNYAPKFIMDGLVEGGFIVDDDSTHVRSITLRCEYCKHRPRTEIVVSNIKI